MNATADDLQHDARQQPIILFCMQQHDRLKIENRSISDVVMRKRDGLLFVPPCVGVTGVSPALYESFILIQFDLLCYS